ncbi:Insect cuticle protein [Trinorchestia longiramus]|nr:Insect cuticle protein [Trinorchestia longiramus]
MIGTGGTGLLGVQGMLGYWGTEDTGLLQGTGGARGTGELQILDYWGYRECWGTGVLKILDYCTVQGVLGVMECFRTGETCREPQVKVKALPAYITRRVCVGLQLCSPAHLFNMFSYSIVFTVLLVVVHARPDTAYSAGGDGEDQVPILRDDRVYPSAAGEYSTDTETGDGIRISESGYGSGPDGAVESQGSVQFTHPGGEDFELTYVANAEGGYQPESSALPVAPEFPHEIPQFVLDQIAKAAEEDRNSPSSSNSEERSYN